MDRLVSNLQKRLKQTQNKKGMTMFSLFLIIIVVIFLTIIFSNPEFIRKINRGRVTTAWSNELSSLSNGLLSLNNNSSVFYPVRLKETSTAFDIVVPSPPLSAYDAVHTYKILKNEGTTDRDLTFKYDSNSIMTVSSVLRSGTNNSNDYTITAPPNRSNSGSNKSQISLTGISNMGSQGLVPFINLSIPNIEESLLLGLMNLSGTDIGVDFAADGVLNLKSKTGANSPAGCSFLNFDSNFNLTNKSVCGSVSGNDNPRSTGSGGAYSGTDVEAFMSMVFGTGSTKEYNLARQTSWISLKLIDTEMLQETVGGNYRFYNKEDYNMFWVNSIAPKADAVRMFQSFFDITSEQANKYAPSVGACNTSGACDAHEREIAGQIYDSMLSYIQPDSIIVIPTTKSGSVYSSNSDFRLYKFSTTD